MIRGPEAFNVVERDARGSARGSKRVKNQAKLMKVEVTQRPRAADAKRRHEVKCSRTKHLQMKQLAILSKVIS